MNEDGVLARSEREYLALYFVYELNQPWLLGSAYFEQQLIDYAPSTIYGFWAHVSGNGTSAKNNRSKENWLRIKKTKKQEAWYDELFIQAKNISSRKTLDFVGQNLQLQ